MEESPTLDTSRFLGDDTRADTKDRSPTDSKRVNFADDDDTHFSRTRALRDAFKTDPSKKSNLNSTKSSSMHQSKTPLMSKNKASRVKGYDLSISKNKRDLKNEKGLASESGNATGISALRTTAHTKTSGVSNFLTKAQIEQNDMEAFLRKTNKEH